MNEHSAKRPSVLTIDRAAFLLLRVKRAFKKKRQQRKEKLAANAANAAAVAVNGGQRRGPPPLLRSRTLPAIVVPGLSILQAQIDPTSCDDQTQLQLLGRGISANKVGGLKPYTPRISFTCKDEDALDLRRRSATSRLGCSPRASIASEDRNDGVLRVPTPRGSVSSTGSSTSSKIARFLSHGSKGQEIKIDDAPRRLSWERRESSGQLPRSGSIDSMVEAVICARLSDPSPHNLTPGRADRALSLVSPAVGRRAKTQRGLAELQYGGLLEGCGAELPSLSACAPLPQSLEKNRKKDAREQDRLSQIDIHLRALFAAVEHGYLEKARNILVSTDVDVNSRNADGLSPLDVAVLTNNRQLAKMLMEFGAKEGNQYSSAEALGAHLRQMMREAESQLHEILGSSAANINAATTGCAGGAGSEKDKQAQYWEKRLKTLKRVSSGLNSVRVPPAPLSPALQLEASQRANIRLRDAIMQNTSQPGATRLRVEWSSRADFSNICGAREVAASGSPSGTTIVASELTRGRRYFFRAAAGNIKGWGPYAVTTPRSIVPSSWRDVSCRAPRGEAGVQLDCLAAAVAEARQRPTAQPRAVKKKTTIRQLFTAASKFQKHLRRGVYLANIIYHEDKVLVTSEEFLPVIEVDETYPTCIYNDFHWLMKVSCSWDEVKALRADMEKHTSSSIHFRLKLLTAVAQMQSAAGVQNLGQLYHKPLRDSHGTVVLSFISNVKSQKAVSALNSRWVPVSKLRRRVLSDDNATISELLMASVHEQIAYHQVCGVRLSRGLYVGYLKLQSSVEVVRVVAPAHAPNVPPHLRLRDNPHISAEEWEYLKSFSNNNEDINKSLPSITSSQEKIPSEAQTMFLDEIGAACRRLFKDMEIPLECALTHRLYDLEVIELNSDVSFIMVCPPAELACSVPGQKEILLQRGDLLSLPIQAFEMIHLQTYHNDILNKYSKLSCLLELDVALANHSQREAFSCSELQTAKEKLSKLEDLQNNLNAVWKTERWLMDLISFARDKASTSCGISMKHILEKTPSQCFDYSDNPDGKIDHLQIPCRDGKITKTSPGRGSWPGPAGSHANLHPEFSKSEQHLSLSPRQTSVSTLNLSTQYLAVEPKSRKNSEDSQFTQSSNESPYQECNSRMPPSRSDDTLVVQDVDNQKSMSTTSSPLLTVKGYYPGSMVTVRKHSESAQSLSSDSDSSYVVNRPNKIVISSKSMTNVPGMDEGKSSKRLPLEAKPVGDNVRSDSVEFRMPDQPGILQVFAAYETGLAAGTSLKLHVTPRTTAREVIDLVVKQLNMAAVLKGKQGPVYGPEKLQDFCLVAVIGARERCLRDDFRPLLLQNPWRKGRLYVRLKHDVLAAIQHSAKQPAFI